MNNRSETRADILREMREQANKPTIESCGETFPPITPEDVCDWADRIEAAAERECRAREDAAADYALKRGEDIHADRCKNCVALDQVLRDITKMVGNAAALREALEEQLRYWNAHVRTRDEEEMRKRTAAALAAPARNCDRFATAEEAWAAWDAAKRPLVPGWHSTPGGAFAASSARRRQPMPSPQHTLTPNTNHTTNNQHTMNIEDLTIREAREIAALFGGSNTTMQTTAPKWAHPFLGKRVLVRTYSAGVHIGTLVSVNPDNAMECHLKDALRLWKWEGGGLSLSAVAHNGIKGGRLNHTDEMLLTNAIEYIPTTEEAEKTYAQFVED